MGHSNSRSVILEPPPPSCSPPEERAPCRRRVLPLPPRGGGRRGLRATDNGSALHAAGTIRGGVARGRTPPQRIEFAEGVGGQSFTNLTNHRMFHSDPNIARRDDSQGSNRRSCGGGVSRVRCTKKKSRAPPPPNGSNLSTSLPGRAEAQQTSGRQDLAACKCIVGKTRAPQPPPPPVAPPATGTRTTTSASSRECNRTERRTGGRGGGYEKKLQPLEKWRHHCRSAGDVRVDAPQPAEDSSFREEIRAVTREIARNLERTSPPKFYFADPGVFVLRAGSQNEAGRREEDAFRRRSLSSQQEESKRSPHQNIDVRLKPPVLPRKPPPELPMLASPAAAAWRAPLDSDGSRSSSERRCSVGEAHWTPHQDLSDDVGSDESEEVVPRARGGDISARFSLPAVMFSSGRPLGMGVRAPRSSSALADDDSRRRRFVTKGGGEDSDSNWTFGQSGFEKRGRQYSSELLLSSKRKRSAFGDFLLGDVLVSTSNHMRRQMKFSDSGYSNFSFYSTDGRVAYAPDRKRFVVESSPLPPPTRGWVSDMRRRFDTNLTAKRKAVEAEADRRRGEELARMLEEEVRRRRSEEKIGIRQQLRSMKQNRHRFDDEDEAYFTEPKSREEEKKGPFGGQRWSPRQGSPTAAFAATRGLNHWQSSPALLEDSSMGRPPEGAHGRLSSSESEVAVVRTPGSHHRHTSKKTGDGSSSSSSSSPSKERRRRRGGGVYQQLMDIVRKEERQLHRVTRLGGTIDSDSRGSSDLSSSSSSSSSNSRGRLPPPPLAFRAARSSAQPYSPGGGKSYRPVPFACSRLPG